MNEIFKSVKSNGFGALLIIFSLLLLSLIFGMPLFSRNLSVTSMVIGALFIIIVIILFIWFWSNTYYIVKSETLKVISGPVHWTIPIQEIKSIKLNQNAIEGVIKPALSWKCIVINYSDNKSISISPQNQEQFLKLLKERNQSIEIN